MSKEYLEQIENRIIATISGENVNLKIENKRYREALQYLYDRELEFVEPDEDVTGFIAEILGEALEGED